MKNKYDLTTSRIKVFISSSMEDDFQMERRAAICAFFERMPMYKCFIIENTASPSNLETHYTANVLTTDIFVLILSGTLREPVRKEYQTAFSAKKKIFVFVHDGITDVPLKEFIKEEIQPSHTFLKFADLKNLLDKIEECFLEDLANSYKNWNEFLEKQGKQHLEGNEGI